MSDPDESSVQELEYFSRFLKEVSHVYVFGGHRPESPVVDSCSLCRAHSHRGLAAGGTHDPCWGESSTVSSLGVIRLSDKCGDWNSQTSS